MILERMVVCSGCRTRRSAKKTITSPHFRSLFGHFSDAPVAFFVPFLPDSFCRTPFAAGWVVLQIADCSVLKSQIRFATFSVALGNIILGDNFVAVPKPKKLAEMKFQIFSHKTWSDKLGGILGEDLWVILYSKWSTKMRRKFRPILRPILRPDFRPSHKNLSPQFRSGESLGDNFAVFWALSPTPSRQPLCRTSATSTRTFWHPPSKAQNLGAREPQSFLFVFSVATPAEPRGEKELSFVQILGGEKSLKFVEKCRWNIFKRPERGKKKNRSHFGSFFGSFFAFFKPFFVSI